MVFAVACGFVFHTWRQEVKKLFGVKKTCTDICKLSQTVFSPSLARVLPTTLENKMKDPLEHSATAE